MSPPPLRIAIVNRDRLDWDGRLSFEALASVGEIVSFADDASAAQLAQRAAGATVLITKEIAVPAEAIAALPDSVRLICEAGTGFNNIDLAAAAARGIAVCNVPAYSTDAVAQLVLTALLNLSSGMCQQQRMLARGDLSNFEGAALHVPHFELAGKTLGLVGGNGAIGARVATLAEAFGMRVLLSSRSSGVSLDELLAASDFVSLHCPLNEGTRHLIDARALALMKPSACLVNTARGAVVDEAALVDALRRGVLTGAALDVQECEPPPADSPLYSLDNVILTPHIGWKRIETRQRCVEAVAANVAAFLGGKPTNIVSPSSR